LFNAADMDALWITLRLATVSTAVLLTLGTPLAWWLAHTGSRLKNIINALVALPLVLPPTVLGFYLLLAFSPAGPVGRVVQTLGGETLAFSFTGLVIGSVIYSLPFVVHPLQDAFARIGQRPLEVAATLGASRVDQWLNVALPLARPGYITAAVFGFAHTLGEFGVVLMIGGNIPGTTQVLSIAIYDHVETLQYGQAHMLSGFLLLLSFALLFAVYTINRRFRITRA